MGGVGLEGQVAQFVDDQEFGAAELRKAAPGTEFGAGRVFKILNP